MDVSFRDLPFWGSTSTLAELGQAMIHCMAASGLPAVLEVRDIVDAAHRNSRVRH